MLTLVTLIMTEHLFQFRTVLACTVEGAFQTCIVGAGKHTQYT